MEVRSMEVVRRLVGAETDTEEEVVVVVGEEERIGIDEDRIPTEQRRNYSR